MPYTTSFRSGLGITGGTFDKLESIPGFRVDLSQAEAIAQLERIGVVMMGQTAEICPADKKLYALRDLTRTVPSPPLSAAPILSQNLPQSPVPRRPPVRRAPGAGAPRGDGMAKMGGIPPDQVREGVAAQTMLGRWAEPKEIGDAAAWIVSEKNSYMTGTIVEVCGGFSRYI